MDVNIYINDTLYADAKAAGLLERGTLSGIVRDELCRRLEDVEAERAALCAVFNRFFVS
jgi:hypothetical protein